MSIVVSSANTGLTSIANLSNPVSCTKLIWAKYAAAPAGFEVLLSSHNGAYSAYNLLVNDGTPDLCVSTAAGLIAGFPSNPNWAHWNCYAMTADAAGFNSLVGYWQDSAGGGFVSEAMTGASFTITNDDICCLYLDKAVTLAYYMEWGTVLTPTQLQARFVSKTPVTALSSLRRYLELDDAASAGTDSSGNGFHMTVIGSIADGTDLPTFGAAANSEPPLQRSNRGVNRGVA